MKARGAAAAKINLALVVGPRRDDGMHELLTVYQRVALVDRLELRRAESVSVDGFVGDTIVRSALEALASAGAPTIAARIQKRIPVGAGLGGGSADAAAALALGNTLSDRRLSDDALEEIARRLGADVPFFLRDGPQLGAGDGSELTPLDLPQDYWILLVLPRGEAKRSTEAVYAAFDARGGERGFDRRRDALRAALADVRRPRDLARLPPNDLASSSVAGELRALGAFRADVSGAGPTVYGLFHHRADAEAASARLAGAGKTWITAPAWYV